MKSASDLTFELVATPNEEIKKIDEILNRL